MDSFHNIIWRCLNGSQRHLSAGTDRARRYAPGFSPLIAFADPAHVDFDALDPFCAPGERAHLRHVLGEQRHRVERVVRLGW